MDENTPAEEKPEKNNPPETDTTESTENPEKKEDPGLSTLITELKTEYEKKIEDLNKDYQARLSEREEVIKQILTGNPNQPAPTTSTPFDEINNRRNFKIW